jgi:hypothetical protein
VCEARDCLLSIAPFASASRSFHKINSSRSDVGPSTGFCSGLGLGRSLGIESDRSLGDGGGGGRSLNLETDCSPGLRYDMSLGLDRDLALDLTCGRSLDFRYGRSLGLTLDRDSSVILPVPFDLCSVAISVLLSCDVSLLWRISARTILITSFSISWISVVTALKVASCA